MRRREPAEGPGSPGPGSPGCPDLLRHVGSPRSPLYRSFFEEECLAIAARLRAAAAAEASPDAGEGSAPLPAAAGPLTSTPLQRSPLLDEGILSGIWDEPPSRDGREGAASPGAARGVPRRLPQPAAGGCPSPAPPGARPQAPARKAAQRGAGRPLCRGLGRPRTPGRSPGRGSRLSLPRARAPLGPELPRATRGLGAPATRLPRPAGTKLKAMPPAVPQPTARPTAVGSDPAPAGCLGRGGGASGAAAQREKGEGLGQIGGVRRPLKQSAAKAGGRRQPSQRLCTAIPTVASSSRLRPLGEVSSPKRVCLGSTTLELTCNRTQELKEDGENKERLDATGTVLGAGEQYGGKANLTWVCGESSFTSGLTLGLTPGCRDAVPAEQSADDQLSQELKRVKNELERVKGELADRIAQCDAYRQMISSLRAQLRAAGICPE